MEQTFTLLLSLFYGTIVLVSALQFYCSRSMQGQNVHFRDSGVVVACNHLHQKAQQKCVLVDVKRICHSVERQTDAVVMYQAALRIQPKHKGRLSIINTELTNQALIIKLASFMYAINNFTWVHFLDEFQLYIHCIKHEELNQMSGHHVQMMSMRYKN